MTEVRQGRRWAVLFAHGAAVGILGGGVQQALRGLFGGEQWNWAAMAASGLVWAVVWPPAVWLARRAVDRGQLRQSPAKSDRDRRSTLVSSAVAAGALPGDPNRGAWQRALRDEIREVNGVRWALALIAAIGAVLIAAAAVVANHNHWGVWAVAFLVAAESAAALLLPGRRLRIARRLLAELTVE